MTLMGTICPAVRDIQRILVGKWGNSVIAVMDSMSKKNLHGKTGGCPENFSSPQETVRLLPVIRYGLSAKRRLEETTSTPRTNSCSITGNFGAPCLRAAIRLISPHSVLTRSPGRAARSPVAHSTGFIQVIQARACGRLGFLATRVPCCLGVSRA